MDFNEYQKLVSGRYRNLTLEEKAMVDSAAETPAGSLILNILGPELVGSTFKKEAPQEKQVVSSKGLGSRV